MADPSRFPHLALPFALIGAAAGWLSAGLVANPLVHTGEGGVQEIAALFAMVFGAGTGLLLTYFCVRKKYRYELEEPAPAEAVSTDRWWRHIVVVLAAGAGAGAVIATVCDVYHGPKWGAFGGVLCALAFVPVCVAVILAARRARRARLGSVVAASDRRAVWGILATTLAVATLEGAIDWPAAAAKHVIAPWPALGMLVASGLGIAAILFVDLRALRGARGTLGPGLAPRDPAETQADDTGVPRVDLGLGDDVAARVARSNSAYRGRDRTLAVVQGSPEQAFEALRRAVSRGVAGLVVTGLVLGLHVVAASPMGRLAYDRDRCVHEDRAACRRVASADREQQPGKAAILYEMACDSEDAEACATLARMYEHGDGIPASEQLARSFHERACDAGVAWSCRAPAIERRTLF